MNILIVHRPTPDRTAPGLRYGAEFAAALRRAGAIVDLVSASEDFNAAQYDYSYLYDANSPDWALPTAIKIKQQTPHLLIYPVWVTRSHREYHFNNPLPESYYDDVALTLSLAECLHTRTMQEAVECWQLHPGIPAYRIGAGHASTGVQRQEPDGFVLSMGRVEPHKNQLNLARACRVIGVPLICAGSITDQRYALQVEAAGGRVIGPLEHAATLDLLSRANVHALPSFGEVVSLASQEAVEMGVPAVMTMYGSEPEYFGSYGFYCDPSDVADIALAIRRAWNAKAGPIKLPTWDSVAARALVWMRENNGNN